MSLQPRKILPYALAGWIPGGRRHCALCGHHVWRFMPYRNGSSGVTPLLHALDVVGSDVDHFECPRCGSHDRERHLMLFLRASGLLEWIKGKSILDFAPEKRLPRWLQEAGPASYTACNLYPQSPQVRRVDMLDIDNASGPIDLVIANHALEYVADEGKTLSELLRILAPGCTRSCRPRTAVSCTPPGPIPALTVAKRGCTHTAGKTMCACSAATSSSASPLPDSSHKYAVMRKCCPIPTHARPVSIRPNLSSCSARRVDSALNAGWAHRAGPASPACGATVRRAADIPAT